MNETKPSSVSSSTAATIATSTTSTPIITTIPATTIDFQTKSNEDFQTKSNEDLLNEIISLLESFEHLQHATTAAPKFGPSSTINFYDLLQFFTTQPTTPTTPATPAPIERHIEKIADRLFEKFIDKLENEIIVRDLPNYSTNFSNGKENARIVSVTADPRTRPIYHLRTSIRRHGETAALPRIVIRKNEGFS